MNPLSSTLFRDCSKSKPLADCQVNFVEPSNIHLKYLGGRDPLDVPPIYSISRTWKFQNPWIFDILHMGSMDNFCKNPFQYNIYTQLFVQHRKQKKFLVLIHTRTKKIANITIYKRAKLQSNDYLKAAHCILNRYTLYQSRLHMCSFGANNRTCRFSVIFFGRALYSEK